MKVLITQVWLDGRGGSEAVVRDTAIGLLRRGHRPIVYSPKIGATGAEIRQMGIAVVDDLRSIAEAPDVIHGQHYIPTAEAIIHFPDVPVVNVCHAWEFWVEKPIKFPQVRKYIAISEAIRDRLVHEEGIQPNLVEILPNAVDLSRIPPRKKPLPSRPLRAACFSSAKAHIPLLRAVCARNGIHFTPIGNCGNRPSANIERELVEFDIVFATGRSALEAAGAGCAVIICDQRGCAGMLTSSNLSRYQRLNFALRLLADPVSAERLQAALESYDPHDAAEVSKTLSETSNLDRYLDRLLAIYEQISSEDRADFHGQSFRNSMLSFLREALPRTPGDARWPWLADRESLTNEIRRLDEALYHRREITNRKPLRRALRSVRSLKHRMLANMERLLTAGRPPGNAGGIRSR